MLESCKGIGAVTQCVGFNTVHERYNNTEAWASGKLIFNLILAVFGWAVGVLDSSFNLILAVFGWASEGINVQAKATDRMPPPRIRSIYATKGLLTWLAGYLVACEPYVFDFCLKLHGTYELYNGALLQLISLIRSWYSSDTQTRWCWLLEYHECRLEKKGSEFAGPVFVPLN
ncbi:hypothetical protein ACLOJK_017143 [Asimina triloba]